ncbi:uncharacterized protein LOC143681271 isoform X1 [Tamandua tetradactyla]|uniref:uncharacterized protein LOC143681271 isoform X1 n=1 Tax=Tamandua tetradactyla TaxID=48850 RepID=UPI004053B1C8
MSLPAVPRSLQLPPGQRARPAFREQRRHNLKELLLERKARFVYKEDYRTLSSICGILLQSIPSSRVLNRWRCDSAHSRWVSTSLLESLEELTERERAELTTKKQMPR